jgi:putative transposase
MTNVCHRLYCQEELQLHRKRPRRWRSAVPSGPRLVATAPNEIWAMDFMHDTLADGWSVRVLTLIGGRELKSVAPRSRPSLRTF